MVESVKLYPWNWGGWVELAILCASVEKARSLELTEHWMADAFSAHLCLELQHNKQALEQYNTLCAIFPQR